ncbi:Holliday junction resolvase RecU [Cohnella sp.]|uniref:Holliday junction resolvase RecU n=1 Tax=Cohnella sp. TaxID=1883426 RepID=UPI0035639CE8
MRHSRANRGMAFEMLIEHCNMMYEIREIAIINKRPTPVKITSVVGNRVNGMLTKPSTVDYDGHYQQRGVAFEAKSVSQGDRFPISNLEKHQFDYLARAHYVGGAVSFIIVEYQAARRTFLLPYPTLERIWRSQSTAIKGSKSIYIADMERDGFEVKPGRGLPLDYLAVVDVIWDIPGGEAGNG